MEDSRGRYHSHPNVVCDQRILHPHPPCVVLMDEYRAKGSAQRSGFATGRGPFGPTLVEAHSWRRGRDRGKHRLTHGIYGTEKQIYACLEKTGEFATRFHWNEFRNGKFMVW